MRTAPDYESQIKDPFRGNLGEGCSRLQRVIPRPDDMMPHATRGVRRSEERKRR